MDLARLTVRAQANQPGVVLRVVADHEAVVDLGPERTREAVQLLAHDEERRAHVHANQDPDNRRRVRAGPSSKVSGNRPATARSGRDERRVAHHGRDLAVLCGGSAGLPVTTDPFVAARARRGRRGGGATSAGIGTRDDHDDANGNRRREHEDAQDCRSLRPPASSIPIGRMTPTHVCLALAAEPVTSGDGEAISSGLQDRVRPCERSPES